MEEWRCVWCGHHADDYEETGTTNLESHNLIVHNLTPQDSKTVHEVVRGLMKDNTFVASQWMHVEMMSWPDHRAWLAAHAATSLPLIGTDQALRLSRTPTVLESWGIKYSTDMLRDITEGKVLPNALEALQFTFLVTNVTRVTTHQLVRTRVGASFLQQTSRPLDLREQPIRMPLTIFGNAASRHRFARHARESRQQYADSVDDGMPLQDARFLLPEAICTHIVASYNAMALIGVMRKRLQNHMQWEINSVMRDMRQQVRIINPYFAKMLYPACEAQGIGQCQLRDDTMAPCGKFPNPLSLKWKVSPSMNPHGYKFDMTRFGE